MEAALARYADRIRAAASGAGRLQIVGGGTKAFYGGPLAGDPLDVREYSGVVNYEPSELVATVRCGTPLAEFEAVLAEHKQMLPFEPPHFGPGATVGGCIAAGLSGPRRAANGLYYGAVRDYVLGCRLMDGRGEALRFGGEVMKNVAGYDVSRLVTGSMGTLGVILEVSLKVLPVPVASATLLFEMDEPTALARLNEWGGRPLPLSASAWQGGRLSVRLEGARAAVDAGCASLGGEPVEEAEAAAFWQGIRNHTNAFFTQPGALWRLSVPSKAPSQSLPDSTVDRQLIEWGGALRWWKSDADAAIARRVAQAAGGHATLFRGGPRSAGVFQPLEPVLARLHKNVKAAFDPAGIFNPGRLYPE